MHLPPLRHGGRARLPRPSRGRARPAQTVPPDGRRKVFAPFRALYRRARRRSRLLRKGSKKAQLVGLEQRPVGQRLPPKLQTRPAAVGGGGPRRARRLPVYGDGRPRLGDGRQGPVRRLPPPVGRHRAEKDVYHRRHRLHRAGGSVHRRLRSAARHRLFGDLRRHRPLVFRQQDAGKRGEGRICRRDGARLLQHRARGHAAGRQALLLRQPAGGGPRHFGRGMHPSARPARAPQMVRLRLLPAQRGAADRLHRAVRLRRK